MPTLLSFCTIGCVLLIIYRFNQGQKRSSLTVVTYFLKQSFLSLRSLEYHNSSADDFKKTRHVNELYK